MSHQDLQKILAEFSSQRDWDQFHSPKNLSIALGIECSELQEIFLWQTDKENQSLSEEKLARVKEEIGDIFIYLLRFCSVLSIDLEKCAYDKLKINEKKYPVEKVRGSAQKYNEY